MNRQMRRASERNGIRLQRQAWAPLENVTDEARARHLALGGSPNFRPDAVFQNPRYIVQVFHGQRVFDRPATKLMIRRSDAEPICSWPDLQRIKNELFGDEATAVQFFPPESELVDDANLYWLFVLGEWERDEEKLFREAEKR